MIFGFLRQNLKTQAVAVAFSMAWTGAGVEPEPDDGRTRACERLGSFRRELHGCLTARGDELFELADAVLCADGPVRDLAGLSLVAGHRRGEGGGCGALDAGPGGIGGVRWAGRGPPPPRRPGGRGPAGAGGSGGGGVLAGGPRPGPPGVGGPPREHGPPLGFTDEKPRAGPRATAGADTARYGTVQVAAWNRMHPKLCKDAAWEHHPGKIPVVEGTLIQLRPGRLPGYRELKPMWPWASAPSADPAEVTGLWQALPRRFDLEHTFRL